MNFLNAVFWDYPQFTDKSNVEKCIQESKGSTSYLWFLRRFLEHGRVVDTMHYFSISEISENLSKLNLMPYAEKKWKRIIEVYSESHGK